MCALRALPKFRAGWMLAAISAVATLGLCPPALGAVTPPAPLSLDGTWQFQPDPGLDGTARGLQTGAGSGWRAASVPGVFDPRPLPQLFHGTVGWYRLQFAGPATPAGFAWALRFEQVRRTARVWLNGREIGSHDDPYTPFDLPAQGLRPGAPNVLVVRVDNRKGAEPREGWWNWGGIVRSVRLVPLGPVALSSLGLMSQVSCSAAERCTAQVLFDGWLTNRSAVAQTARVAATLTPPGGGRSFGATVADVPLAPGQTEHVRQSFPVAAPVQLWEPGHPALYDARVQTVAGGQPSQLDELHIGMRSVVVRNGALYLNGRRAQLSGASIEEDMPGHGPALTPSDMDAIVAELQALHANVTRAQYPLNPALLDRLDRAGILVWSQAPIYHRDELLVTPAERHAALATLRGTVLDDRSHPSVITYSVANELSPTPDVVPGTREYLNAAADLVGQLDPTLPPSLDLLSYPGYPRQVTYERFPLLGINNYFGWYPARAPHATAQLADLAPYLQSVHGEYPSQAMVMTEFGAEATRHGSPTQKQTYEFQSAYVRQTLAIVRSLPFMNGAIYWTLREFAVKPHWIGGAPAHTLGVLRDSLHHKGLISYQGVAKPAWALTRSEFAATPLFSGPPVPVPAARPASPSSPFGWFVLAAFILLGVLALVALDLRLFLRIRTGPDEPPWSAPVVALRREDREAERHYA